MTKVSDFLGGIYNQVKPYFVPTILIILVLLGLMSVFITPIIEPTVSPILIRYGDTVFGQISFVFIRVINVVFFPVKLSSFTTIYNRVVGFWTANELSFFIFSIGGTINYLIGRKYRANIYLAISKFPLGKHINKVLKKFQHLTLKNQLTSILLFTAFSYEPFSYLAGMKKVPFKKYLFCLLISASLLNLINISRDITIGQNQTLAITLQLLPYILGAIVTIVFLEDDIADTFNQIKQKVFNDKQIS